MGVMVKSGEYTKFHPVGVDLSTGSDAEATAEHIKSKLRRIAILSSGLSSNRVVIEVLICKCC